MKKKYELTPEHRAHAKGSMYRKDGDRFRTDGWIW